jgi:excisionase family DNA binding protein
MAMESKSGAYASRYLSRMALAKLLGIHESTVRTWVADGRLPPPIPGFGKRQRWSRQAVVEWANARGVPLSD